MKKSRLPRKLKKWVKNHPAMTSYDIETANMEWKAGHAFIHGVGVISFVGDDKSINQL